MWNVGEKILKPTSGFIPLHSSGESQNWAIRSNPFILPVGKLRLVEQRGPELGGSAEQIQVSFGLPCSSRARTLRSVLSRGLLRKAQGPCGTDHVTVGVTSGVTVHNRGSPVGRLEAVVPCVTGVAVIVLQGG